MKNLLLALVVLAGLMFACKPSSQEPTKLTGPAEPAAAAVDSTQPAAKPIPDAWAKLSSKVGNYMYDTIFFKNPVLCDSLKAIMPKEAYDDMMLNWDVASDLKRYNNLLVANGCKHENCFNDLWLVIIDMAHSDVNAYNIHNRKLTIYAGSKQIHLPDGLEAYITKLKNTGGVPANAVEVK
jgi:hypothetical protein